MSPGPKYGECSATVTLRDFAAAMMRSISEMPPTLVTLGCTNATLPMSISRSNSSGDPAFYTTPHYDGYGAILVDLERVERDQLEELVEEAWRERAPVRVRKAYDAARG